MRIIIIKNTRTTIITLKIGDDSKEGRIRRAESLGWNDEHSINNLRKLYTYLNMKKQKKNILTSILLIIMHKIQSKIRICCPFMRGSENRKKCGEKKF